MKDKRQNSSSLDEEPKKVKFEIFGEEMLQKEVKLGGNSGRVYLPTDWIGKHVKIVRTD